MRLGNRRLVDIVLETLSPLVESFVIVANSRHLFAELPALITTDIKAGTGPLGGILSGLLTLEHEHALVVACDMPFLNTELLRYMLQQMGNYDVVMPRVNGNLEPLHAVYSRACIEPIRRLLDAQDFKIIEFLHEVRVRYVEEEEIDRLDPSHLSFLNINTLDDLERAQVEYDKRCGQRSRGVEVAGADLR